MTESPDIADVVALHRRADGVVVSPDVLQEKYGRLCRAGSDLACRWRAWDDFGEVKSVDLARLASPACAGGDEEACLLVAWAKPGVTVEDRIRQLEPLCTAGVARACTDLGLEVWRDPVARPVDLDRARGLHRDACEAGVSVACRRAVEAGDEGMRARAVALGDPAFLPPREACDAGLTSACVALVDRVEGPERLALRERLCWMDDAHCPALLAERVSSPGVVLDGRVARFYWGDGAVLIGWESARGWTDHSRIDLSGLQHATLHVGSARKEWFVLTLADGTEIPLPEEGCDAVVEGATALATAGRPARAVGEDGGPTRSVCIDLFGGGDGPRYRFGSIVVEAPRGNAGQIGPAHSALAERSDALYACAESSDSEINGRWRASFVAGRDGEVSRTKQLTSSGDPSLDTCLSGWLAEADLGKRSEAAPLVVTVEIPY